MTSRRAFLLSASAGIRLPAEERFSSSVGLQLYSLRREAQKDLANTLALVSKLGFRELEVGGFYGRTAAEFQRMLAGNGLKATSLIASWDQLSKSTGEAADQAHTLGAAYVSCTSIPRKKRLTIDDVTLAAQNFNRWGKALAGAGLRFCFHPHGPEFVNGPDGTLFDTMAKIMDPAVANFEMDVFWFVFGNQDPARMLEKYSGRFPLMHVKDIRKGEPRTFNPGTVPEEASVPLGKGEVDWPSVLRAARKAGVRHYYIEEEHPDAVNQIQESLRYLDGVRL